MAHDIRSILVPGLASGSVSPKPPDSLAVPQLIEIMKETDPHRKRTISLTPSHRPLHATCSNFAFQPGGIVQNLRGAIPLHHSSGPIEDGKQI